MIVCIYEALLGIEASGLIQCRNFSHNFNCFIRILFKCTPYCLRKSIAPGCNEGQAYQDLYSRLILCEQHKLKGLPIHRSSPTLKQISLRVLSIQPVLYIGLPSRTPPCRGMTIESAERRPSFYCGISHGVLSSGQVLNRRGRTFLTDKIWQVGYLKLQQRISSTALMILFAVIGTRDDTRLRHFCTAADRWLSSRHRASHHPASRRSTSSAPYLHTSQRTQGVVGWRAYWPDRSTL